MTAKTAAISSDKVFVNKTPDRNAKRIVRISRWQRFRRFLLISSLTIAILIAGLAAFTVYSYQYYSQIVAERLANGFWQTRSGIYAAPRTLQAGQRLSPEELDTLLRRAGYVENAESTVWNGSFTRQENAISINQGAAFKSQPSVTVSFNRDHRIDWIRANGGATLAEFKLQPELLTDGSGAKTSARRTLDYKDLPPTMINAILAIEDRRFFEHGGVDARGFFRALWMNISGGEMKQGGSTITQQLVKNTFLTPERTLQRKFAEGLISIALERSLSKQEILALYCNEIYLGQRSSASINGVEQAAHAYFGKSISELSLSETAAIAAMIKSPNRFLNLQNREKLIERRNQVLANMAEYGFISNAEAKSAQNETLNFIDVETQAKPFGAYFVDSVRARVEKNQNMNGWRVHTTIDSQLQEFARNAVAKQLDELNKKYSGRKPQAALVAIDPKSGNVVAMVGGSDYATSQLNRATDSFRQPGSTFKPIVYATALESGLTAASRYEDKPAEFLYASGQKYSPQNYGGHFSNQIVTMKTALVKSLNTVTVGIASQVGISKIAAEARNFGLPIKDVYPSLALGTEEASPLEMASAYTVFANGGTRVEPSFISDVVGGNGRTIYANTPQPVQVISAETAYIITDMLTGVVTDGTARSARNALSGNAFAGKTGTSNDGWFIGYTPNLVCAVWIGFDDNKDLKLTGADAALPAWVDFMRQSVEARPEFGGKSFPAPATVTRVTIDPETGMLAGVDCPRRESVVMSKKTAPSVECYLHQHQDSNQSETYEIPAETEVALNSNETTAQSQTETSVQPIEASTIALATAPQNTTIKSSTTRLRIVEITKSAEADNDF